MSTPWTYAGSPPALSRVDGTVTLVDGQTFCLSGSSGDVVPGLPHGLFVLDTRVLSRWQLRVNGHLLEPLAAAPGAPFEATFMGRGHPVPGEADAGILVFRHRSIGNGLLERIAVRNHGLDPCGLVVELLCDADFAGLFEVKEDRVPPPARAPRHEPRPGALAIGDAGGSQVTISVAGDHAGDDAVVGAGTVAWRFELAPREERELCVEVGVRLGDVTLPSRVACGDEVGTSIPSDRYAAWLGAVPAVETDAPALG